MADSLRPLGYSHDATALEEELKALFVKLYADSLQATADDINVYGAPHNGSFELVERNIEIEGLSVMRQTGEDRIRYLFKAWRHRNPERGLYFLRLYLSALFGGYADVQQLWHDKSSIYPNGVRTALEVEVNGYDLNDYFLTSRVRVDLDTDIVPSKILSSLRSSVAARLLLNVRIGKFLAKGVGMAGVGASVNVARLSWMAGPARAPLAIVGTLPGSEYGQAYEGRLMITGARGTCTVSRVGGDPIPVGATLTVDQAAKQIVLSWPAGTNPAMPIRFTLKVVDGRGQEAFWTGEIDEGIFHLTTMLYPIAVEERVGVNASLTVFEYRESVHESDTEEAVGIAAELVGFEINYFQPINLSMDDTMQVGAELIGFEFYDQTVPASSEETMAIAAELTGFELQQHPTATTAEDMGISATIEGFEIT